MSIKLMDRVWESDLPSVQKFVLLALADNANDAGVCWPSIATIARKCGLTERSVYEQLKTLEGKGLVSRQSRDGRSTVYTLDPCQFATPERGSGVDPCTTFTPPLNHVHPTPEPRSPRTIKEPPIESNSCGSGARTHEAKEIPETGQNWKKADPSSAPHIARHEALFANPKLLNDFLERLQVEFRKHDPHFPAIDIANGRRAKMQLAFEQYGDRIIAAVRWLYTSPRAYVYRKTPPTIERLLDPEKLLNYIEQAERPDAMEAIKVEANGTGPKKFRSMRQMMAEINERNQKGMK